MTRWTDEDKALALAHGTYAEYTAAGGTASKAAWSGTRSRSAMPAEPQAAEVLPDRGDMPPSAYYDAVKALTKEKIALMEREKAIEWTSPDQKWTGIVFLGDIHIGGLIDYERLESDLRFIEATDGLHAVGMGDYGEFFQDAFKLQHAMSESTAPATDDQMILIEHVLKIVRKWIVLLLGNHDGWAGQKGIRELSERLGADYASEAGCALKCTVGEQRYVAYLKHQWKGHSNINTSNESRRFWQEYPEFENADFTVLAHYHQPDTHIKEIKGQTVTHLRGGTYKLVDEYAFKGGYVPAYGPSLVLLNPRDHEVLQFHGPHWRRGVEFLRYLRGE